MTVGQVIARMTAGAPAPRRRPRDRSAAATTAARAPHQADAPESGATASEPRVRRRRQRLAGRPADRRPAGRRPGRGARHRARAAGSPRPTCSRPQANGGNGAQPPAPDRAPRTAPPPPAPSCSRVARPRWPATWTRAARSRRRPRSARSRSPCSTQRRAQLKEAGHRVSFTHLIAYAIARVATEDMPVMAHHFAEIDGKPHRIDDGACNLGLAVDVEKKDGTPHADGAGDPRRRADELRRVPRRLQRAGREGADEHADRRRPDRRQRLADQPRRDRHDRLGAAADGRPGHDRRHRLDRLSAGPGRDRRGDRRREGHDDDLDLRPPDHPGRRVRPLPAADRGAAPGRGRLLRAGVRRPRAWPCRRSPVVPAPAAPAAVAAPPAAGPARRRRGRAAPDEELLQAVQAATSLLKAHRTHGHLAAQARPARPRARGRSGARPRARSASPPS